MSETANNRLVRFGRDTVDGPPSKLWSRALALGAFALVVVAPAHYLWESMAFGGAAQHNATVAAQAYADAVLPGSRAVCSVEGPPYQGNCNVFLGGVRRLSLDCDDDPPAHNDGCELRQVYP